MENLFFEKPILNSPYDYPASHWELDETLNLIIEIKGYRGEDAKEKKSTMDTYWVPGVNNLGMYGKWAFAEFTEVYEIEPDFEVKINSEFDKIIKKTINHALGSNNG